jgi:hypothetical protein
MNTPARYATGGAVAAVTVFGVALFLARQGIDDADKISSVISMVVGGVALAVAIWSIREAKRAKRREAEASSSIRESRGNPAPTRMGSRNTIKKVKNVGTLVTGDGNVINAPVSSKEAQGD